MLPNSKVILSYFSVYAQLVRNLGLTTLQSPIFFYQVVSLSHRPTPIANNPRQQVNPPGSYSVELEAPPVASPVVIFNREPKRCKEIFCFFFYFFFSSILFQSLLDFLTISVFFNSDWTRLGRQFKEQRILSLTGLLQVPVYFFMGYEAVFNRGGIFCGGY